MSKIRRKVFELQADGTTISANVTLKAIRTRFVKNAKAYIVVDAIGTDVIATMMIARTKNGDFVKGGGSEAKVTITATGTYIIQLQEHELSIFGGVRLKPTGACDVGVHYEVQEVE